MRPFGEAKGTRAYAQIRQYHTIMEIPDSSKAKHILKLDNIISLWCGGGGGGGGD